MKKYNLAIFASGSGSNAEKIITYFQEHARVQVKAIFTNKAQAGVVSRAQKLQIPLLIFDRQQFYESGMVLDQLLEMEIEAVILAGFLWLVPPAIIRAYPGKILNIHPALLPKFGGPGMYGMHVHQAVLAAGEKKSGITIHEVNEEYDQGRIVFQATCEIAPGETPQSLVNKIHKLEHQHYPRVIEKWLSV